MSKFDSLWEHVAQDGRPSFVLTFDEVRDILGFEIDHSFLNCKKELPAYGYAVGKISLKNKQVAFEKIGG